MKINWMFHVTVPTILKKSCLSLTAWYEASLVDKELFYLKRTRQQNLQWRFLCTFKTWILHLDYQAFLTPTLFSHIITSFKSPNYSILLNTICPAEGQLCLNKSTGFTSLSKYEGETAPKLYSGTSVEINRVRNPTLGMPHLWLSWKLTFITCGAPNKAKWILERSVGKRLGWDFPRECLSLCSLSCLVTCTVCTSQGVWRRGQKPSSLGTWGQGGWTRGFAHFAWRQPSHPGNPRNSVVTSGNLEDEHSICGKKIAKDCLLCVLLSREPLMCFK